MAKRAAKKYLSVKYEERELAKRLGARWDPSVQKWYCPAGSSLATVFKWRREAAGISAKTLPKHTATNQNFELPLAV